MSAQAFSLSLTGFAVTGQAAQTVSGVRPTSTNFSSQAGAFVGRLEGAPGFNANPFYTYCVQLAQTFNWGNPLNGYSIIHNGASYFNSVNSDTNGNPDGATIVDRLGKLFTFLGGVKLPTDPDGAGPVTASQVSAAIQVAVWESIYQRVDTSLAGMSAGNGALNAMEGAFRISNNDTVRNLANQYLTGAAAVATSLYSISVLYSASNQDFLLVQRVPVPASLALVALALGLMWGVRRRA